MRSMFSSRQSIILAVVVVFLVAVGAALGLGVMSKSSSSKSSSHRGNTIWKVGDTWTVKVQQDSASISPDTKKSTAYIPFHFTVTAAPKTKSGEWLVHVTQDGAEGPFKNGWHLAYTLKNGVMTLTHVGAGDQKMIESDVASIVLGSNFPYETSYKAAPTNLTVTSKELATRSALPPLTGSINKSMGSTPGGTETSSEKGTAPPVDAPILKAGQVPPGAPPDLKG